MTSRKIHMARYVFGPILMLYLLDYLHPITIPSIICRYCTDSDSQALPSAPTPVHHIYRQGIRLQAHRMSYALNTRVCSEAAEIPHLYGKRFTWTSKLNSSRKCTYVLRLLRTYFALFHPYSTTLSQWYHTKAC